MPTDDQRLLRRTHAGHEPSARELWSRHAGWMAAYAGLVLGSRNGSMADDVVQSVFCRVLSLDRRAVRLVQDVRPWLAHAIRHEALNHLRTVRRAAQRELQAARRSTPVDTTPDPNSDVAAALASLPRRQREVAYLRHVAGLTVDQTALALDLPRGTVASRTRAAIQSLRDRLESPEHANLAERDATRPAPATPTTPHAPHDPHDPHAPTTSPDVLPRRTLRSTTP
ncbi:MAG: sigma-70 family RNA polymerase sigma factor [Planctomycetota bacterium]|nr:sigma-70 family RNA polymerase sigma factor [Planctomycetota bacterium]